jgi:hypothetical protein
MGNPGSVRPFGHCNFSKLIRADFVHRDIICPLVVLMRICADIHQWQSLCVWKPDAEIYPISDLEGLLPYEAESPPATPEINLILRLTR